MGDPGAGADRPVVPDRAGRVGDARARSRWAAGTWSRARAVADDFDVPRAYGSYPDLLADDDGARRCTSALPNSLHAQWSDAAARAGKHVLCEKPLGRSAAEAEAMFEVARECGVWLMEAFMYRFHPRTLALAELVARGDVGEPRLVRASFGFTVTDAANVRLSAELAGGALMDVGCYPVNAARMLAGPVAGVAAAARWADSGRGRDAGRHARPRRRGAVGGVLQPGQQPPQRRPAGRHRGRRGRAGRLHPAAGPAVGAGAHAGRARRRAAGDPLRAGRPVQGWRPRASPRWSRPGTTPRRTCRRCRWPSPWTTPPPSTLCCAAPAGAIRPRPDTPVRTGCGRTAPAVDNRGAGRPRRARIGACPGRR